MDLINLALLRDVLSSIIIEHGVALTHSKIPLFCTELGLLSPDEIGTKRDRMTTSFNALSNSDLPKVAERLLTSYPPHAAIRNQIQDILWTEKPSPPTSQRIRREVAQKISRDELFIKTKAFDDLLEELWVLDANSFSSLWGRYKNLRDDIQQHVYRNPEDWSVEELFEKIGALDASDKRFALFLEGLSSAKVRPDEAQQRQFVQNVNEVLKLYGLELREFGLEEGYPVFRLVQLNALAKGRPKNIIFASEVKPDLRFSDALDNDVEIVTNVDKVLIYDRPIGAHGLTWNDLQDWWADSTGVTDSDLAKKTLYRRLEQSLPDSSNPQKLLFSSFFSCFGKAIPNLPALLPEVWLHWDPKTVKERGKEALLRSRMDFLLLLPNGVRVVIEVDGMQHYADEDGKADVQRYAKMVRADRDLKLAGYEVFRFGGAELQKENTEAAHSFFKSLFRCYGVIS